MTLPPFDGTTYRKTVLSTLRDSKPAEVEDLFWLALVPREVDNDAEVAERLKATRGFLFKERTRARQAAVAQAVLNEWQRVEATLLDPAARAALRRRLEQAAPADTPAPTAPRVSRLPVNAGDRRRRQVSTALAELARLRDDPDLAVDLYAFLGLPETATREMLATRITRIAESNRRKRPDRERALVDDLLAHARKLLVEGDPAEYLAGFDDDFLDRAVQALLAGEPQAALEAVAAARLRGLSDTAIVDRLTRVAPADAELISLSPYGLGVWCPACGAIAAMGADRCHSCNVGLRLRCAQCSQIAPADSPRCPSCQASLDAQRAPLVERRGERAAEAAALAEVDAAPAGEREARLRAIVRQHPGWARVARALATLPPAPPREVHFVHAHGEVVLSWEEPAGEPPEAYLVERHRGDAASVLGRTSLLTWTDSNPGGDDTSWSVRALRGNAASERATASAPPTDEPATPPGPPTVSDLSARGGRPIVLTWTAPAGTKPVLTRTRGDAVRRITPDVDGYTDRHVQLGAKYTYTVALEGVDGSERTITVAVDGAAPAEPKPAPAPSAPPSGAISELATRREDARVLATWAWPAGTTEVFVAWDTRPPTNATAAAGGRKVTNTRYEIDGGAVLEGVPPEAHLAVFTGHRSPDGKLTWRDEAPASARTVVP